MATRGAANGQYTVIISVDAKDAEATLAALSGTVDDVGGSMQTVAPRLTTVGTGLNTTARGSAAMAAELDRAEGKARSLLRTLETGALNGSFSSVNSALAGVATAGGTAALAVGGVAIAAVAGTAAAVAAANAYADQALAMEDAARSAGVLTPEISANADKAREWQNSTQRLSDEFADLAATIGEKVAPLLTDLVNGISAVVENADNLINSSDALASSLSIVFGGPILEAIAAYGASQSDANGTDAARIRTLNELTASLEARTQAEADAAQAVSDYAAASVAADQADLRVAQLRAKASEEAAAAEEARAAKVAAATKSEQSARERLTEVEEQSAQRVAEARNRVADAQRRLNEANRQDRDQSRNLADAQLRLRRTQEDIASGKLSGVDATRAYQDAVTDLERTQEDNIDAERKRQEDIADAERDLAEAKRAKRDAEVQAARDIRRAQESVREAVDKVTEANKRAGKSALDRRADELALRAALLAQAQAHQRVRDNIAEVKAAVADGTLSWGELQKLLKDLHANTFPAIKGDLDEINARLYSMPGSSYAVGGSTYQSQVPQVGTGGNVVDGITAGAAAINVTINGGAIVADKRSADAIGAQIANGVVAELKRQNASGVRFNIK